MASGKSVPSSSLTSSNPTPFVSSELKLQPLKPLSLAPLKIVGLTNICTKTKTLGNDINLEQAYKYMMMIKTSIIRLDLLARNKDIQDDQLKTAILLSSAPIIDRIRGVTEFFEVENQKKQFKVKRKKYKMKTQGKKPRRD